MSPEQADALNIQNADSWKRQADSSAALKDLLMELYTPRPKVETLAQEQFMQLLNMCMTATTKTLTLASSDATRSEAAVNAVEMAVAAFPSLKVALDGLST